MRQTSSIHSASRMPIQTKTREEEGAVVYNAHGEAVESRADVLILQWVS
jgi:hypothetical protein